MSKKLSSKLRIFFYLFICLWLLLIIVIGLKFDCNKFKFPHKRLSSLEADLTSIHKKPEEDLKPKNVTKSFELQPDDFNRLIELTNFEYLIKSNSCDKLSQPPLVLILIHSAPRNFLRRHAIRETWGKLDSKVQIRFLLAAVNSSSLQSLIELEAETHGDFIQGNFHDSFRNLTYKHVMALKFFIYECPKAKFLLKTDDDVFVNVQLLLKNILNEQFIFYEKFSQPRLIYCAELNENAKVRRFKDEKWKRTFEEFGDEFFTDFCSGFGIFYSSDVIKPLYIEAQKLSYFWVDNVFVTGLARSKTDFTLTTARFNKNLFMLLAPNDESDEKVLRKMKRVNKIISEFNYFFERFIIDHN